MILVTLINLIQELLIVAIIYCIGKILSNSTSLRKFLGLRTSTEVPDDFTPTTEWVENIGKLVILVAFVKALFSLVSTIVILWNM